MDKFIKIFAAWLFLCGSAQAQQIQPIILWTHHNASGGAAYTGPGDIQTFTAWYSCSYAYSAAKRGTKACNVCEHTGVTCIDVNSDATTGIVPVPSPGGSACNTSTNICTVKTFYNQVSAGTLDMTQATQANQMVFDPAGTCTGLGASISCNHTPGGGTGYGPGGTLAASQPYSFAWTANITVSTAPNKLFYSTTNTVFVGENSTANRNGCYATAATNEATAADGSWHATSCQLNSTSSTIKVDTNGVQTGDSGASALAGNFSLFTDQISVDFNGHFASAGVSTNAFSNTDLTNLNANAHTILGF